MIHFEFASVPQLSRGAKNERKQGAAERSNPSKTNVPKNEINFRRKVYKIAAKDSRETHERRLLTIFNAITKIPKKFVEQFEIFTKEIDNYP